MGEINKQNRFIRYYVCVCVCVCRHYFINEFLNSFFFQNYLNHILLIFSDFLFFVHYQIFNLVVLFS